MTINPKNPPKAKTIKALGNLADAAAAKLGRPRTIENMKAYKADKAREYRAKKKAAKGA